MGVSVQAYSQLRFDESETTELSKWIADGKDPVDYMDQFYDSDASQASHVWVDMHVTGHTMTMMPYILHPLHRSCVYEVHGIQERMDSMAYGNYADLIRHLHKLGDHRDDLLITPSEAHTCWDRAKPFYHLIMSNINESVFGTDMCWRLSNEFQRYRDWVLSNGCEWEDNLAISFIRLHNAFKLGSFYGMVEIA